MAVLCERDNVLTLETRAPPARHFVPVTAATAAAKAAAAATASSVWHGSPYAALAALVHRGLRAAEWVSAREDGDVARS